MKFVTGKKYINNIDYRVYECKYGGENKAFMTFQAGNAIIELCFDQSVRSQYSEYVKPVFEKTHFYIYRHKTEKCFTIDKNGAEYPKEHPFWANVGVLEINHDLTNDKIELKVSNEF